MAKHSLEIKAAYSGTWRDDDVTDNIIRQIVAQSIAEKGKKIKLSISPEGLKVTKSNFFQGKIISDFIPLANIYFMTVNQHNPNILLAIIKDVTRKYMILAFKCKTPVDAGNMVHHYKDYKDTFTGKGANFELKRKDNGNWTLKSRSASNARRHLLEIYGKPNGDVKTTPIFLPQDDVIERDEGHVHGRDQHNIAIQTARLGPDVDSMSEASDVTIRDELDSLAHELREIKYLLEKSTGISAEESVRKHRQMSQPTSAREPYNSNGRHDNHNDDDVVVIGRGPQPNGTAQVTQNGKQDGVARISVPDYRSFGVQTAPKSKNKSLAAAYPGFIRVNGSAGEEHVSTPRPSSVVITSQAPATSTVVMTSQPVQTSYVVTPWPENGKPKPAVTTHTVATTTTTTIKKESPKTPRKEEKHEMPEYAVVRRRVVPREDGPERLVATRSTTLPRPVSEAPSSPRSNHGSVLYNDPYIPQVRTTYHTLVEKQPTYAYEPGYYVKYDPRLLPRGRRPHGRKMPVAGYHVPSTVQRPIEDTYPRGATLRRVLVPAELVPRRMSLPHSVHGMQFDDDDLRLYDPSLDERKVPAAPGTFVYHHEMF